MFSKLLNRSSESGWRTVAIDTRFGWHYTENPDRAFDHIVLYQINDKTGKRRLAYDDADKKGREYAESGNAGVAKARTLWEQAGKIRTPSDSKDVEWLDPVYAPHGDFEDIIVGVERDSTLQDALDDNPQVKQAWEHFVTSVKMTKNL